MLSRLLLPLCVLVCMSVCAESWDERMYRQLNKKVTLELVDTPLVDAVELLQTMTRVNIVIAPAVRMNNPKITLKVSDMDAGTALKWLTQLTETHAELVDQAIYITDQPNRKKVQVEKDALQQLAADRKVVLEMPAGDDPLTDQDRVKIALQLFGAEEIKIQDFPGPVISLDQSDQNVGFRFFEK